MRSGVAVRDLGVGVLRSGAGKGLSWALCLAALGAPLLADPARADVIEIGDGGAVRVRSGGGDVQWVTVAGAGETADIESAPDVPAAALTEVGAPQVPAAYAELLRRVADAYKVSPDLLAALVRQESGWRADAVSGKGARGLAQLMPGTARQLRVDAADPAANLAGGAAYLRAMLDRFDGDVERALAAYNAGPGRVERARGVPAIAETRSYVATILARLAPASLPKDM